MLEGCAALGAEAVAVKIEESIGPESLRDDIALLVVRAVSPEPSVDALPALHVASG
jgi:hypothetical protein